MTFKRGRKSDYYELEKLKKDVMKRDKQQVNTFVDVELYKKLKFSALVDNITLTQAVEAALNQYLEKRK